MGEENKNPQVNQQCNQPASFSYIWPGEGITYICYLHIWNLLAIAAALGVNLEITQLSFEETYLHKCDQKVKEQHA